MKTLSRQLRALALLLDYPTADTHAHLGELTDLLAGLEAPASELPRTSLMACIAGMAATDLMDLQADFVDTFDRGRSTSLNLFEQVHGDSRDRGQAMVDLLAQYQEVGLSLQAQELPDYLPVYLEYASILEPAAARETLQEVVSLVANLANALERRTSRWVPVAAAVCRLAGVDDWQALVEQEAKKEKKSPVPGPRDVHVEGLPEDWTAAGLDAVWAEEPVDFLGACSPQHAGPKVQTVQFMPRPVAAQTKAQPQPQGV
jgi:nitrate reductase delta subunit